MRYSAITDATGPDVIARAVEIFGPNGHGLTLADRGMLSARFESPVGYVALETTRTGDHRTEVEIETREFDREVEAFIGSLPRQGWLARNVRRFRSSR